MYDLIWFLVSMFILLQIEIFWCLPISVSHSRNSGYGALAGAIDVRPSDRAASREALSTGTHFAFHGLA
jgi:hypothetical protein